MISRLIRAPAATSAKCQTTIFLAEACRQSQIVPIMKQTLVLVWLFVGALHAEQKSTADDHSLSPDRKWEYRVIDSAPVIVKADSSEVVVKLPGADGSSAAESGEVIWAPDSRRFAFNYRSGTRYCTCAAYELAGSTWKVLPDFEEKAGSVQKAIAAAKLAQIRRLKLPADANQRRIDDTWRALRWLDNATLELFAYSESSVEDESVSCGIVFRARCDNRGGWKIISKRTVAKAELKKLQREE